MATQTARLLARAMATPLTGVDMTRLLGRNISIITYDELQQVRDVDELFDDEGRCMLLYLLDGPSSGHWVCLNRFDDHIEFFDPIGTAQGGGRPDSQLHWIDMARRRALGADSPLLMRLLKSKRVPFVWNTAVLQKDDPHIATCGRHCAVRTLKRATPLDDYVHHITHLRISPDEYVTKSTFGELHK